MRIIVVEPKCYYDDNGNFVAAYQKLRDIRKTYFNNSYGKDVDIQIVNIEKYCDDLSIYVSLLNRILMVDSVYFVSKPVIEDISGSRKMWLDDKTYYDGYHRVDILKRLLKDTCTSYEVEKSIDGLGNVITNKYTFYRSPYKE